MKKNAVLLGVTGSIAAYKSCDVLRRLQDEGCEVSVIMTQEAEHFITPLTLATLSQRSVYRDMFIARTSRSQDSYEDLAHIALAKWADLFVIAPATANVLGKIAHGIADDLLTCTAITTTAPIVIAPAMNVDMWSNKIVQNNIRILKQAGMHFIAPKTDKLACGEVGKGALAEVADIVKTVKRLLK